MKLVLEEQVRGNVEALYSYLSLWYYLFRYQWRLLDSRASFPLYQFSDAWGKSTGFIVFSPYPFLLIFLDSSYPSGWLL